MKKKTIKIYDENWNLEQTSIVEIPTLEEEKEMQKIQQEKDYLYQNKFLRFLAKIFLKLEGDVEVM